MGTLAGRDPADTFKDLLKIENSGSGFPADATELRTVEDGSGQTTPLRLAQNRVSIGAGTLMLGDTIITATGVQINQLVGLLSGIDGNSIKIQLRRANNSNAPNAGDLDEGELHVALGSGVLYYGYGGGASVDAIKVVGANQLTDFGVANGVASLDVNGTLASGQIPSVVAKKNGSVQVDLNSELWNGARYYVENVAPDAGDGSNGDFHFQYEDV